MNKTVLWCLLLLSLFNFAFAATGVSPAAVNINFEPNKEQTFTFMFVNDAENRSEFYLEGELKEYFSITSHEIIGGNSIITVYMKLPEAVQKSGTNRVYVGCREKSTEKGISISYNIKPVINIEVPYPNKYVDIDLKVNYTNKGENSAYDLYIVNRGKEDVVVLPELELKSGSNLVKMIYLEGKTLSSLNNTHYKGFINTSDISSGDYNITASVEYGGHLPRTETRLLRIGELTIQINNYTNLFKKDKIIYMNVEIESFWNNRIDNVFINGSVVGYPEKKFQSPTYSISPWDMASFSVFIDTEDLEQEFQVILNVNYEGKITTKIVNASFTKEINWTLIIIITCISIVIILIVIILLLKKDKHE